MTPPSARLRDPLTWAALVGGAAAAAWLTWLAALAAGGSWGTPPRADLARVDFAAFWGAARLTLAGRAGESYLWPSLAAELRAAFHVGVTPPMTFLYPPPMLLALAPLGRLPYTAAFAVWTATGLCAYAAAVWAACPRPAALVAALAPAGVFFCAYAGQNGFLTAAALGGGLALLDRRPLAAGVLLCLFACKPHLAVLAPVALVAGGRWRALAAMAGTYAALCAVSAFAFGPSVFLAFLRAVAGGGGAFAGGGWLPWWKVQSLYGALRGAGASTGAALAAQGGCALACATGVAVLWRSRARSDLKAAVTAAAVLLTTPYTFVYDGPILGVALAFLLRDAAASGRLTAPQGGLLAIGLLGQSAFLPAPSSLVTPLAAAALLATALLRAAPGLRARRPSDVGAHVEVEVEVLAAARVEGGGAARAAAVASQVLGSRQLVPASAAEHGGLVPLRLRPHLGRMALQGVVALAAGVVAAAAPHLQRDDVGRAAPVGAARLRIQGQAEDGRARRRHLRR